MDSIKLDTRTAKMIAHRGLSGIEKENTNAAFVAAGNRSYFGIETDVHKTVDGKFIIIHDDTTGRVAIDNLEVEKSTFETLRKLSLCDIDDKRGRADLHIPTLTEYISTCKRYGKTAVLELKNAFTSDEVAAICDEIKGCDYLENVIFISFVFDNLVKLREIIPESEAQFLVDSYSTCRSCLRTTALTLISAIRSLTPSVSPPSMQSAQRSTAGPATIRTEVRSSVSGALTS